MKLLRNLNKSAGGKRIAGIPWVGKLASEIPTGFPIPALLLNDIDGGAVGRLYSVQMITRPGAGDLYVYEDSSYSFMNAPDGVYSCVQRVRKWDPATGLVSTEDTTLVLTIGSGTPPVEGGTAYATHIIETFESRDQVPRANLSGLRWYVWAEVGATPLKAPIAQGIAETTDSAGVALFDITGQNVILPGALVSLLLTNSTGDASQANLISWFGVAVAY